MSFIVDAVFVGIPFIFSMRASVHTVAVPGELWNRHSTVLVYAQKEIVEPANVRSTCHAGKGIFPTTKAPKNSTK
jgi:hypothetical protein